jgi:hypothetical protein
MRSNCLAFAVALYCRRKRSGHEGYLVMRRSRWGPFPHLLYAERRQDGRLRIVSYIPISPKQKPIPPVTFKGQSKWGDL